MFQYKYTYTYLFIYTCTNTLTGVESANALHHSAIVIPIFSRQTFTITPTARRDAASAPYFTYLHSTGVN